MLYISNFQLSLFLTSTKSYRKFRTIRGSPQKWVGFGKPLLLRVKRRVLWLKEGASRLAHPVAVMAQITNGTHNPDIRKSRDRKGSNMASGISNHSCLPHQYDNENDLFFFLHASILVFHNIWVRVFVRSKVYTVVSISVYS